MGQEISIIQLILNASIIVQLIILALIICSIISWGIILKKWIIINHAKIISKKFLHQFENSNDINNLYNALTSTSTHYAVPKIFFNGIKEYNQLIKNGVTDKNIILTNLERTLSYLIDEQTDYYDAQLSTLATFGSVSPYIGLLGTVWGIMHSFIGLGNLGQATLSSVAPGIAEALVATAIGLFVAIPAYMFYNKFIADVNSLNYKMTQFADKFLNMLNK